MFLCEFSHIVCGMRNHWRIVSILFLFHAVCRGHQDSVIKKIKWHDKTCKGGNNVLFSFIYQ